MSRLCLLFALASVAPAFGGPLTLETPSNLTINLTGSAPIVRSNPSVPLTATDTLSPPANPNGVNATAYSFTETSTATTLNVAPTHVILAVTPTTALSSGSLNFTVAYDTAYFLSGSGTFNLGAGGSGLLNVTLTDTSTSTVLFNQGQAFGVGTTGYTIGVGSTGSPTGGLLAANTYRLDYAFQTIGTIGSSFTGNLQLVATPEPTTLGLLGMGVLAAALRRRRAVTA